MRSVLALAEMRVLMEQRQKILKLNDLGLSATTLAIRFSASEDRIRKAIKKARQERNAASD